MKKSVLVFSFLFLLAFPCAAKNHFFADSIKYMDHLKSCTPHIFSYQHPFAKGFIGQNIIKGKKGDRCFVTIFMPNNQKMECNFSPPTIKILTAPSKYEAARQHKATGSNQTFENSQTQRECKVGE